MTSGFLMALALAASPAPAADTGHCDSKPFTLKKPSAPTPRAAPEAPKPKPVAAAKPAKPRKSKYVVGCKQPKG